MAEGLKERIQADVKDAMRARDKDRLATLRMITAGLQQKEVDDRVELDDAGVLALLDKMAKQRRESIEQYEQGGRAELAERERAELAVIESYLPQPLSDEELDALVAEAIAATGAAAMADMGRVMGELKPRVQGRADMGEVSARVKARLGG
ncbi:GatB/YqeY domain-containing protein [Thiohalospira sp.]|uniref:GatB/YqeY domain-containing protein n=1 Tax=Thiohalospira sp. TaxID=3080549 RepID=UPI00398013CC